MRRVIDSDERKSKMVQVVFNLERGDWSFVEGVSVAWEISSWVGEQYKGDEVAVE